LPKWLNFDSTIQIFNGLVPFDAAGGLDIQVTATDAEGLSASDIFTLDITNVINGNKRPNYLTGTVNKDIINGFGKSDRLFGRGGDDVLNGHKGNDRLYGGVGNDILDGGNGKDKLYGGYGDDQLHGGANKDALKDWFGNNILNGGEGNDKLFSGIGNDQLEGGSGRDRLFSGGGNDILHGGPGFDQVKGGRGDDTYLFNLGDDIDVINERQGEDILRFGEGITEDDLWLWRDHKDLNIGIIGTEDQVTIEDWYRKNHHKRGWHNNNDNRIEQIELSGGLVLLEGQIQQLVDAMASFSVQKSGSLDVPQAIQDDVQSVIAVSWQAA
jgi:Ca2+-binding RTX toxin-like protein